MHRPGPELQRITVRHKDRLLFGSLPWVSKARQEHDVLSQELRDQGAEVLYFTALLQDVLEYQAARDAAIGLAVADAALGDELRHQLRSHLEDLGPEQLAQVLIAGLTPEELKIGHGVVFELLDRHDFVLDPLPNLVFTKDTSFWIGDHVAVASLAAGRRRRESDLATVIYQHHPRFAGAKRLYESGLEHVDGGDVLLMAAGVVAIGVGHRTSPAGTERLASRLLGAGLAHTVLAVPLRHQGSARHLDTLCAVVDRDAVVMHPAVAYSLTALTISLRGGAMRVSRAHPFLEAAAQAMGIERLRVIDTGTDPGGQGDDGSNVLAIGPRVAVSHERNSETNMRLEGAGVRVIRVPSSELGSIRGGPRCMTCAVGREPAAAAATGGQEPAVSGGERIVVGPAVPGSREGGEHDAGRARPAGPASPVPPAPVPVTAPGPVLEPAAATVPVREPVPAREPVGAGRGPGSISAASAVRSAGYSSTGWYRHGARRGIEVTRLAARTAERRQAGESGCRGRQQALSPSLQRSSGAFAGTAAARPAAHPEDAEQQPYSGHNNHEQGNPRQCLDDGQGDQHDQDDPGHQQQHSQHVSTLRRPGPERRPGPAAATARSS
jgi:arginine deiminase